MGRRKPSAVTRALTAAVAAAAVAGAAIAAAQPARATQRQLLSRRDAPSEAPAAPLRPTDAPVRPTEAPAAPTKSPSVSPTKSPTRATPRPTAAPTAPSDSCLGYCNAFAPSGCSCRANCVPDAFPPTKAPVEGPTYSPVVPPTEMPARYTYSPSAGIEQCCPDACEICGYGTKDGTPDGPRCVPGLPTKAPTESPTVTPEFCINAGTIAAGERGGDIEFTEENQGQTISVTGDTSIVDPTCFGKGVPPLATFLGPIGCFSDADVGAIYHKLSFESLKNTRDWVCLVETCETEDKDFDTAVRLYLGNAVVLVGCQDDGCGLQSSFKFNPSDFEAAGNIMFLQVTGVSGFASDAGPYTLSVTCGPPPPDCLNSGTQDAGLLGEPLEPFDDSRNDATSIVTGDTSLVSPLCRGAGLLSTSVQPPLDDCYVDENTAIYHELSLEGVSDLEGWTCLVETCDDPENTYDTAVRLYDSSQDPDGTLLACIDDGCDVQTEFDFIPSAFSSSKFLIQVTGFFSNQGPYTLKVKCGTGFLATEAVETEQSEAAVKEKKEAAYAEYKKAQAISDKKAAATAP